MKKFPGKYFILAGAVILGASAGFIYWQEIGCISGTCPITSTWYSSTLYGGIMSGLLVNMFQKEEPKEKKEE